MNFIELLLLAGGVVLSFAVAGFYAQEVDLAHWGVEVVGVQGEEGADVLVGEADRLLEVGVQAVVDVFWLLLQVYVLEWVREYELLA